MPYSAYKFLVFKFVETYYNAIKRLQRRALWES